MRNPLLVSWLLSAALALPLSAATADPHQALAAPASGATPLGTQILDAAVTSPDALNAEATALGPQVNVFASGGKLVPVSPAFIPFRPTVYPRPFNRPPFGF